MMKKLVLITLTLIAVFSSGLKAQDSNDLIKQIMNAANVTENQATGGAGALFGLAKEKLSVEDFNKVADVVPNMSGLLAAVPALGAKKSKFGAMAVKLSGNAKVLAIFEKLGISKTKVALFTPVLVNYVENKGGKALGDLLANAIK